MSEILGLDCFLYDIYTMCSHIHPLLFLPAEMSQRTNTLQGEDPQPTRFSTGSNRTQNRRDTRRGFDIISNQSDDGPTFPNRSSSDNWSSFSRTLQNERRHLIIENSHAKLLSKNDGSATNHGDLTFLDKFPSVVANKEINYRKTKQLKPPRDYDIISNVYTQDNDEKWRRVNVDTATRAEEIQKQQRTRDVVRGVYVHKDVESRESDGETQRIKYRQDLHLARQPPRMHYGEGRAYDIISATDKDEQLAQYYDKRDNRFLNSSQSQRRNSDILSDSAETEPSNTTQASTTGNYGSGEPQVAPVGDDANVDPMVKWNLPRIVKPAKGRLQPLIEAKYTELNKKNDQYEIVKRETRMLESENTKRLLAGEEIEHNEKFYSSDPRTLHATKYRGKASPRPEDYVINGVVHPVRSKYESNIALGSLFVNNATRAEGSRRRHVPSGSSSRPSLWEREQLSSPSQ